MVELADISTQEQDMQLMLDDYRVIRILTPTVREQIEHAVENKPDQISLLLYEENNLYLSLELVDSPRERRKIYKLIQQYQIDPTTNISNLPEPLYRCFKPKPTLSKIGTAVFVGAGIGIVCGLIGMALGVMVIAIFGLASDIGGLALTSVIFVLGCALGWAGATLHFWRKSQQKQQITT